MPKQPAFFFYTGDWLKETSRLKPAIKGHWIDLLCALWDSPTRGEITWPLHAYSAFMSVNVDRASEVLVTLSETAVAEVEFLNDAPDHCPDTCDTWHAEVGGIVRNCYENVRVRNRRMFREAEDAKKNREYVKKHRAKAPVDNSLKDESKIALSSSSSSSSSIKEPSPTPSVESDRSVEKKTELNPQIKQVADRIYNSNPQTYSRLVVWIKTQERVGTNPRTIAKALEGFEPYKNRLDGNWWGYLDQVLARVKARERSEKIEWDSEQFKSDERKWLQEFLRSGVKKV